MLTSGIRELELDIHWGNGKFLIYHLFWLDYHTTCNKLENCLEEINNWSLHHSNHTPIILHFEPKSFCDKPDAKFALKTLIEKLHSFFKGSNHNIKAQEIRAKCDFYNFFCNFEKFMISTLNFLRIITVTEKNCF